MTICGPSAADLRRARSRAHSKDLPILAAAIASGAAFLVTHNIRHFESSETLKVIRPRQLVEQARAWMARLGD